MRTHARPPTKPGPPGPVGPVGPAGSGGSGSGVLMTPIANVTVPADTALVGSGTYELTAGITLELGVGAVLEIL